MSINARDILLVIRAKDEASHVIRNIGPAFGSLSDDAVRSAGKMIAVGSAVATVGAGITALGVTMAREVASWTQLAIDYAQQVGLTATQIDQAGVSLQEVGAIGKRVGAEVPVPFEEIQGGLYDIFSSMNVGMADAETILRAFSRGAVAGQVDLQSAGRSTIAILNAFGLGADDVNRVMDVQFQLVRKGVGTYEEFANSIGLALPAAARSGQSIESLSGMMAFLTRNGLSASRAATSAGRALETLSDSRVIDRMGELGVNVLDSEGNFRAINDVVTDLAKAMDGMTDPQRAAALQDIFKGAGNSVQARRFWDTAIKNYESLNTLTADMSNSTGQLDAAYDIMFAQPATKAQLLDNNIKILKTTLGEFLLPGFQRVTEAALKFVQWLNDLPDSTKKFIALGSAIAAIALTIVGVITLISGIALIIGGAITMLGGIGVVAGIIGGIILVVAALAAIAYVVYRNWDTIVKWWNDIWPQMKETAQEVWDWMVRTWEDLWPKIKKTASDVWQWMQTTWDDLWPKIKKTASSVWQWLQRTWDDVSQAFVEGWHTAQGVWDKVVEVFLDVKEVAEDVIGWFKEEFAPGFKRVWDAIAENAGPIIQDIIIIFGQLKDAVVAAFQWIQDNALPIWDYIWQYIEPTIQFIVEAFQTYFPIILQVIENTFNTAKQAVVIAWDFITRIISAGLDIIRGVFDIFAGIFTGDWGKVWEGVRKIVEGGWKQITALFQLGWDMILLGWDTFKGMLGTAIDAMIAVIQIGVDFIMTFFMELPGNILSWLGDLTSWLWQKGQDLISGLARGIVELAANVFIWFTELPGRVLEEIGDLLGTLIQKGKDIIQGFWDGAEVLWIAVKIWFAMLPSLIIGAIGNVANVLYNIGRSVITGFWNGMKSVWDDVEGWLEGLAPRMPFKKGPPSYDAKVLTNNGKLIMKGLLDGMQEGWMANEKFLESIAPQIQASVTAQISTPYAPVGVMAPGAVTDHSIHIAEGAIHIDLSGQPMSEQDVQYIVHDALRTVLQEL